MNGPVYYEIGAAEKGAFLETGLVGRHFFPHRYYHLPKCGPDGYKLAKWMCGESDPETLSELILYADAELSARFPREMWFDRDLIWHEQQFGRVGQVASVNLRRNGTDLYSMVYISDLVQRASRRPAEKSRLENRFKGWPSMLLNAALATAVQQGFRRLFVPRAAWAMRHTDPNRTVQPDLFERVYDRPVTRFDPEQSEQWWIIDVSTCRDRIVMPRHGHEPVGAGDRTICIIHDTERGLGHLDSDPEYALQADRTSPAHLQTMARIEQDLGIVTTYNVVGCLMDEIRPGRRGDGSRCRVPLLEPCDRRPAVGRMPRSRLPDQGLPSPAVPPDRGN